MFGVAIITYITHAYIRARIQKQFGIEDALLLFAVTCLCGATGVAFSAVQGHYDSIQVILHTDFDLLLNVLDDIPKIAKLSNSAATLWWFVIFPVKLAYLFFFRRLLVRLPNLKRWWWCVVAFTIPAGLASVAAAWLTCPYFTVEGVICKWNIGQSAIFGAEILSPACSGASASYRTIRDTSITTVMDVVTDILVVSFPIALLWKVRINLRQKLGLALVLCLSIVMVIIAIVRIAGIRLGGGNVDIVWLAFWMQQECSVAVIMVSCSAFRSFFVASTANSPAPEHSPNSWKRKLLQRRPSPDRDDLESANGLPQIPRPTLTGMRSAIRNI